MIRNNPLPSPLPRRADSGVTLIEMMIVLAVIGVATGAATLGLGALARNDQAEAEARRLAQALGQAVDQALMTGNDQRMTWDVAGYVIGGADYHPLAGAVTLKRDQQTGDAALLLLTDSAAGGPATFVLTGQDAIWQVAFDGLAASAAPAPALP
jgi:general secretion pathway protein H